jgi:hypothetical protein
MQWKLDSLFSLGVLKKNNGYKTVINATAYIKWINVLNLFRNHRNWTMDPGILDKSFTVHIILDSMFGGHQNFGIKLHQQDQNLQKERERERSALHDRFGYCIETIHHCRLQDISKGYWGSTLHQTLQVIPHLEVNLWFPCERGGPQLCISTYVISLHITVYLGYCAV